MARITNIDDLIFPVELCPVYTEINGSRIEVPNCRAVINTESDKSFAVVSDNYRLVTNKEAVKLGKQCCKELFGTDQANIEIFNVDAPSTASFCHIDLVHKDYVMNLWDEENQSEIYIPYVRVTNSYNTSRALKFDVGFCREICFNGVIFESETIKFIFNHVKHELNDDISFALENRKIKTLFEEFKSYINKLRNQKISKENSRRLIHALFKIKDASEIDFSDKKEDMADYKFLLNEIDKKLVKYIDKMGESSYAIFNVITDIASYPIDSRYFRREINSMQRLAGNWINSFQKEIEKQDFSIDNYIQLLKKSPDKALHLSANRYAADNG